MKELKMISNQEFNALDNAEKRKYLLEIVDTLTEDQAKELYEVITNYQNIGMDSFDQILNKKRNYE